MQIVLVSNDLTVVSRVQGVCAKVGATLRTVGDLQQAIDAIGSEPARVVILDLSTPQIDVDALAIAAKSDAGGAPKVIAFAPHVHVEKLAAARQAGCDEVVSRGQFFAQLDAILQRYTSK